MSWTEAAIAPRSAPTLKVFAAASQASLGIEIPANSCRYSPPDIAVAPSKAFGFGKGVFSQTRWRV